MNRLIAASVLVLLVSSLGAVGCESKEANMQLKELQQQCNDLQIKNKELQDNVAEAQSKNSDLTLQLESKDAELAAAKNDLAKARMAATAKTEKPVPPGWERTAQGVRKTLASDILFAPGKATLSAAGDTELKKVAATIKSNYPDAIIRVYGHTDSDPVVKSAKLWQDNLDLSANRAMAVTRYLEKAGLSAARIETIGMGATHPLGSNRTAANKAKNRRVEITVVTGQ